MAKKVEIPDIKFTLKAKDIWRFAQLEQAVNGSLKTTRDKAKFRLYKSLLDSSEFYKFFDLEKEAESIAGNVISYFGSGNKNTVKKHQKDITICVFEFKSSDRKEIRKSACINFFYKKLSNGGISNYACAAIAYAISYELGFRTKTEIKYPYEPGKNSATDLNKKGEKFIKNKKA